MGLLAEAFVHPSAQDLAEHCVACGGATQSDLCAASIDSAFVLTFQEFNLKHVLERGQALLASGGQVRLGCFTSQSSNKPDKHLPCKCKCIQLLFHMSRSTTFRKIYP
jgi:hypothetical protein